MPKKTEAEPITLESVAAQLANLTARVIVLETPASSGPVGDPLAFFTTPSDVLTHYPLASLPLGQTHDLDEAKRRSLYGIDWAGFLAVAGAELIEVHAYIDTLRANLVAARQPGAELEGVVPEVAAFAYLTGLSKIPERRTPAYLGLANAADFAPKKYAGISLAELFARVQGGSGGPSVA